jgi:hypothetical protein
LVDPSPSILAYRGLGIAIAVAAIGWLQQRNVRQLYQPRLAEPQAAA